MEEYMNMLRDGVEKIGGSTLTHGQLNMFGEYIDILLYYNRFMNLTRITDMDEIVIEHFLDSLSIINFPTVKGAQYIMDIGTGAGFPGIPLKIYYPNKSLTLIDSQKKKIEFVDKVIEKLKIKDISTVHGRAEDIGRQKEHRERYDIVVSRAVAPLPVLLEYAIPFVRIGGQFIAYKGPNIYKEIEEAKNAIDILGVKIDDVKEIKVPYSDKTHILLILNKITKTDKTYPRSAGKPKKSPL